MLGFQLIKLELVFQRQAGALTAIAVGLSTAIGTRLLNSRPVRGVFNAGGKALDATMNVVGKGINAGLYGAGKMVEVSVNTTGALTKKTGSVAERMLERLSRVLDVVAFKG